MDTVIDSVILVALCAGLISWLWRRRRAGKAIRWPVVEATIESGAIETVAHSKYGSIDLPVFTFSYQVGPDYFGGRFALRPYITDPGASVVERMIGRKLAIHYDPRKARRWFIPNELIEGCRVEQELLPDLVDYKPSS